MKGSEVEIRNVNGLYQGWAEGTNPHLETMRRAADKKLERCAKTVFSIWTILERT